MTIGPEMGRLARKLAHVCSQIAGESGAIFGYRSFVVPIKPPAVPGILFNRNPWDS